ncbi:MAG: hypothetical protein CMG01_04725, partial [Candidatus Marinimicrobia bacterium]|nr:hypothetical protein [Candidatus Neomarinimicrobiota bacterium]
SDGTVYYNATSPFAGFQFTLVGATIGSASGGIVEQLGLSISASNYNALGFSLTNTEIQPGSGILTQLSGLSGIPTGLTGIVMTTAGGVEFVNSSETNACQNADCVVDLDDDGVCDDVDSCVGSLDACGVCNGPGAVYSCGCTNIPVGDCDCNGSVLDALNVCGGSCALDADSDGVCDDVDSCVGSLDACDVCNGPGAVYDCGNGEDLVCSDSDCPASPGTVVDIDLDSGWNWISTNVLSDNMTPNSVIAGAADGDFLKSQSTFSQYYAGYGWYGGVGLINIGESYKLNLQGSYNWTYTGASVNPADYLINLNSGWNWLGYVPSTSLSTNDALNFSAEDGDFIKSQSTFSQYYAGYGWYGGVTTMTPFSGYLVNVSSNHSFYYPNSLSRINENIESFINSYDFDYRDYEFNGAVTASIDINNVEISEDDILFAFDSNGNIRGKASPVYFPLTNEYIFMLMIYANKKDEIISFEYYDYNIDNSYTLNNTINFQSDMIIGDGFSPMSFGLSNAEEVSSLSISKAYPNPFNPSTNLEYSIADPGFVKITVFDVTGRQVSIIENSYKNSGEHKLTWNAENNTSGIYYIQISSDSEVKAQKVVLLK